jgi:FKBP-type peptidyl-prolyl cis-trans isomerase
VKSWVGGAVADAACRYPPAAFMRKTLSILCIAAVVGGVIAGCGSSSKSVSTAQGVVLAPSGGATSAAATPAASTSSTSTSTTATSTSSSNVKLPTAFNTEPTIKSPGGTPPKKLVVKNLIIGTGPKLTSPSSTITIAYVGALYANGKVFDSSFKDVPSTHTISQPASGFVPGFEQGLLGMRVGGRRELIIPPSLAYGSKKNGSIPANSTLIFIVDLHSIS